ncbi:MAG: Dephospho-CoA kinase [Betaproteobacteria bacterium]|nr:Dephospho-CoA kinase [Betaproteobacteria bacterium]
MAPVIALTGGIGSGKTSVADMLGNLGAAVVDTDEIAHQLTAAGQTGARVVAEEFGREFLDADGALDRTRMRDLVFSDPAAKQRLESLLHPLIRHEVKMRVENFAARPADAVPYIVIVVPLLVETGAYRDLAQRVLVVDCDEDRQIARVMRRSGLAPPQIKAIMANQASREERLRNADDVVRNDGDLEALRAAVEALHLKYLGLRGKRAGTQ